MQDPASPPTGAPCELAVRSSRCHDLTALSADFEDLALADTPGAYRG